MNPRERRAEVRQLIHWLKGDLYERDRDYSDANERRTFTCQIKDVPVDHETEMLWGSPLGWRVKIRVEAENDDVLHGEQRLTLLIFDPPGDPHRGPFTYDEANFGVGINWLEANLP